MGDGEGPDDRARVNWSVPPPPPGVGEAPTSSALGEEFLFHLYRGSELLKDDDVYEAKSELERALSLQPQDVEGQSLLGMVYFRLGHYPRAIQIYEQLVRARPTEVAPRVNLALCHLKTGQLASARTMLEELVQHRPDHLRAWGYLGLAHQRLGDFDKASIAFDRAGRTELAARLRASHPPDAPHRAEEATDAGSGVQEIAADHAHAALTVPPPPPPPPPASASAPPPSSTDAPLPPSSAVPRPPSGAWPAAGTRVSLPVGIGRLAGEATLVFPELPRVVLHADGSVLARIDGAFHARSDCVRAVLPSAVGAVTSQILRRRGRGALSGEPLGGLTSPFATLEGAARLVLGAPAPLSALVSTLGGEPLYVREDRLLGFDASIQHESGRLGLPEGEHAALVHLRGSGFVVLAVRGPIQAIEVTARRPAEVRATRLIGWIGRLLPQGDTLEEQRAGLRGLVTLSGDGIALLDGG
jgi:Flp pilus assembly protein TadD